MNEMHEFLNSLPKPERKIRKPKPPTSNEWKIRFDLAYKENFKQQYPVAYASHGCLKTSFPDTSKANGLTQAIIKYLMWNGHRATRITSAGRMLGRRFIPGTTRKGAADISSTIKGRSVMFEVKVGNDRPSDEQLREQELERKAGGEYFFVHSMDEFFKHYDTL